MVRLTRIYTRGGDKGRPRSATARRVPKQALGSRPTARSTRPMPRSGWPASMPTPTATRCWRASRTICSTSAPICARPRTARRAAGALRIVAAQVERLEREIDAMNAKLAAARFVHPAGRHPGGCIPAFGAHRHPAGRAAGLRAGGRGRVNPEAVKYLNRLSDHLFVLGRRVNDNGARDVLWQPGATR